MLLNRQKEQNSFYQRISLPKTNNPANKSYSTRCISVNKTEAKPVNLNNLAMTKQSQPLPKTLTVNHYSFSIFLEKATMRVLFEKCWHAELLGINLKIVHQLL